MTNLDFYCRCVGVASLLAAHHIKVILAKDANVVHDWLLTLAFIHLIHVVKYNIAGCIIITESRQPRSTNISELCA